LVRYLRAKMSSIPGAVAGAGVEVGVDFPAALILTGGDGDPSPDISPREDAFVGLME
jgi:hypothetical protein